MTRSRTTLNNLSFTNGTAGRGESWTSKFYLLGNCQGAWANFAELRFPNEVKGLRIVSHYGVTMLVIATDRNGAPLFGYHFGDDPLIAIVYDVTGSNHGDCTMSDKCGVSRIRSGLLDYVWRQHKAHGNLSSDAIRRSGGANI